jgi:hypothetical protein
MAYNPFDDVIENDPAYMANGGPLPRPKIGIEFPNDPQTFQPQRSVIPQQRVDPTDQEIFRPFATAIARGYKLLTPEQETLDQIEKDQQLRSLATQQAFQGTEFDQYAGDFDLPSSVLQNSKAMELLDQAGFERQSFTEGFSRIGQFLYGNQRKAFDKLKSGEQLNSEDRLSIAGQRDHQAWTPDHGSHYHQQMKVRELENHHHVLGHRVPSQQRGLKKQNQLLKI